MKRHLKEDVCGADMTQGVQEQETVDKACTESSEALQTELHSTSHPATIYRYIVFVFQVTFTTQVQYRIEFYAHKVDFAGIDQNCALADEQRLCPRRSPGTH